MGFFSRKSKASANNDAVVPLTDELLRAVLKSLSVATSPGKGFHNAESDHANIVFTIEEGMLVIRSFWRGDFAQASDDVQLAGVMALNDINRWLSAGSVINTVFAERATVLMRQEVFTTEGISFNQLQAVILHHTETIDRVGEYLKTVLDGRYAELPPAATVTPGRYLEFVRGPLVGSERVFGELGNEFVLNNDGERIRVYETKDSLILHREEDIHVHPLVLTQILGQLHQQLPMLTVSFDRSLSSPWSENLNNAERLKLNVRYGIPKSADFNDKQLVMSTALGKAATKAGSEYVTTAIADINNHTEEE